MRMQRTISPVDGRILVERELAGEPVIAAALERARVAARAWARTPLAERLAGIGRAVDVNGADDERPAGDRQRSGGHDRVRR